MTWRYWRGFEELIEKLKPLGGTTFLLGKKEGHQGRKNCVDLVNKLNLTQLLVLISNLDILVSCDSGPMHLGFAAGTPTVALFGRVPPQYRMPLAGADKHCAIHHGDADAPPAPIKERKPQASNPLDDIRVDEVYSCVINLLEKAQ
jgi:ADP-heptose:LPS heptosyltransferase